MRDTRLVLGLAVLGVLLARVLCHASEVPEVGEPGWISPALRGSIEQTIKEFPGSYLAAVGVVRGSEECPVGSEPSICCLRMELIELIGGNRPERASGSKVVEYFTPGPRTNGRCEAGNWLGERILEVSAPKDNTRLYVPTYRVRGPTDADLAAVRDVVAR